MKTTYNVCENNLALF